MKTGIDFAANLFDNGLDALAVLDDNLCVTYWNPEMVSLSGVASHWAVGAAIHDLFPATAATASQFLRRSLAGECLIADFPFFAARDPVIAKQCEWFALPLLVHGRIIGCIVVVQQLAGRFDLEAHIREVEQRFRSMADSSPVLLWMAGTDGLCNFFNQSWLEFTGRTMQQELGVGWAEGVHPEDFRGCLDTFMTAFTTHRPFEMEYRLRRHDGEYRWILDRGTPRYLESGEFAGYIGSCVDFTERRRAEQEAREITADLKRANQYMEQLLYAASHDLREPIRMVTSFLDLLQKRASAGLDEEARDYVQFACEGTKRMKSLVGGLLELSRIRAHAPEFIETDITAIVENVLQDLNAAVLESHARIIFGELPVVRADPILFYSLMQNLLSNALKFHGEKAPEIELSARRNADEWIFSVRDNGIGFEPQYAGAVFETFRRLHNREFFPGNGLGLALAREIVTLHKGRIWVSSALGQGADFQFTLPVHL
jgi:PAS domain S-box-containing protein